MVNRSLKTLALRMDHHMRSSVIIARWLQKQPKVLEVLHPALSSHSNHQVALAQSYGHSGIFSVRLRDADLAKVERFLNSLKVFMLVESPAGFESFIRSPIMTTHSTLSSDELKGIGITEGLLHVSVGLEDVENLIDDIECSLQAI
jgi:cystathionine gamma-lyase